MSSLTDIRCQLPSTKPTRCPSQPDITAGQPYPPEISSALRLPPVAGTWRVRGRAPGNDRLLSLVVVGQPSSRNSSTASHAVRVDTRHSKEMARIDGSRRPGFNSPLRIVARHDPDDGHILAIGRLPAAMDWLESR
jgi:hypothetical protein